MSISLEFKNLKGYVEDKDFAGILPQVQKAHDQLQNRKGKGSEFTGWLDLPSKTTKAFLDELDALGREVRKNSDCIVSIGIGGSYIGIRSSLEFLAAEQKLPVYYAGQGLSAGYLENLLAKIKDQRVTVVVISKSGTTTEPALAFRIIKKFMEEKYKPAELKKRIIAITDEKKGALRKIADKEGYRTYPIADDVGGRYSVLSPVGLVPLALAGVDVKALIAGAQKAQKEFANPDLMKNVAYQYAVCRYLLYKKGKKIEILANFNEKLGFIAEWWKQLCGESEGWRAG